MFEKLEQFDQDLLLAINSRHTPFFDSFFFILSDKMVWIPFYLLLLFLVIRNYKSKSWLILLLTALLILVSDQFASGLVKNFFMRYRPSHNLLIGSKLHLVNGYCGGQYGFISSHASNTFALATFIGLLLKDKWPRFSILLIAWAIIVSFSRIYLGVHYPADVIGGGLAGLTFGWIFYKLYIAIDIKLSINKNESKKGVWRLLIANNKS